MNDLYLFLRVLAIGILLALVSGVPSVVRWLRRDVVRYDLSGLFVVIALGGGLLAGGMGAADAPIEFPWVVICLLGLVAATLAFDVWPTKWHWRGLAIAAIGLLQAEYGFSIETLKVPFAQSWIDLGAVGPVITALWIALFAGLFGRAGTIRGVPAGIALVGSATFYAICRLRPDLTDIEGQLMAAAVAGAALPLLFVVGRLQHGGATSGGYVIGFVVGITSVAGALKNTAFLVVAVPLMVLGAPLFAAAYTYISDLRGGWRAVAMERRRRHLHEILLSQGYSSGQVLGLIVAATAYLCATAIVLVYLIEVTFVVKVLIILGAGAVGLGLFYFVLRMLRRREEGQAVGQAASASIFGVKLHPVAMESALAEAARFLQEDTPHMVVTADTCGLMRAYDDPEFRQIVNRADLVTPDGAGVVLAARLLNIPVESRCAGVDMVRGLCRVAAEHGRSVYLLGARPGIAERAADNLQRQTPGLEIAGCHHGYFEEDEEKQIVGQIRERRPGVLFVALGIPRQEQWIRAHLEELDVPICVGVGGSLDVISGLKRRAPVWMQRLGIEWVYRVLQEPERLPRLKALPRIVLLTIGELLRPPKEIQRRYRQRK